MKTDFTEPEKAKNYLDFCEKGEGKKRQELILNNLLPLLPKTPGAAVFEVACGNGFMSEKIAQQGFKVFASDNSPIFLDYAKAKYPHIEFTLADLNRRLPYSDQTADCVVGSLFLHHLSDLKHSFSEINRILKKNGTAVIACLNHYYAFPVGDWKRPWWKKILNNKPKINLYSYGNFVRNQDRTFLWGENYISTFYSLPETINAAFSGGLNLEYVQDVLPQKDGESADVIYRSFRFPLFLILKFTKSPSHNGLAS